VTEADQGFVSSVFGMERERAGEIGEQLGRPGTSVVQAVLKHSFDVGESAWVRAKSLICLVDFHGDAVAPPKGDVQHRPASFGESIRRRLPIKVGEQEPNLLWVIDMNQAVDALGKAGFVGGDGCVGEPCIVQKSAPEPPFEHLTESSAKVFQRFADCWGAAEMAPELPDIADHLRAPQG